ncbi:transglycosylase domain-containing protein [Bacillus methanolicus]|uniref:Penicillin-binding protein n=1 Tax=Bacillus methanolicus (strain MGA3 / ATCC 53907) TaxID=796606 RepID=I3E798_BACMM|nr:penicillin-binding protein 1A [Bacillus methanolicus]AIE59201.1 penicillin-binding protein [Bacillus methanolicus MGA3]EIJ82369.1 penicillin-binding protein [Bacillus methanolicus MGA3]
MKRLQPFWEEIVRFWKKKHITQILLLILLMFLLLTILFFAFMASRANVQSLKDGLKQSTVIYDKDGDVATKVSTNRTEGVKINELPDYVKNAVIAIEDERFYEHSGFDIKGIARAFFKNLLAGRITGGGSTITQQLTKNALLSPEQTYKRKIEELFLAVEIEKNYSKDEILEMYLNQVYFGSGAWGIESAAKKYFNKDIKKVTISEAAMLAGLLQAPSAYDPYYYYDRAIKRRNVVLSKMKELGMISAEEYKTAKKEKIKLEDGGGSFVDRKYPYYVDAVLDEAISKYGLTQDEILTRGYRIYTEMDQNLQSSLEHVYERNYLFPYGRGGTLVQSGAVLLDPATGGVRALVGGRGEHVFRGYNRATQLKAQPGSTLKPLAVYTPALEEGYDVMSKLKDEPMSFDGYKPENFSKTYQGEVPMYEAVEKSLNVPTVWLLHEIGLEKGLDALKRFGIPLEKEDKNLGIALGGMHKGISPLQLAEAYSVFPNEGKRMDSHLITKIVGPTGNVIAEHKQKTTKVTSKSVANKMTSMLLNVVESGTGKGTNIPGVQLAGKTGTTQLPYKDIDGTKDQWFVGYTPNLVGAVWLGYDKTDREHYLSNSSSENVVPIFKAIMEEILPYIKPAKFDVQSVNAMLAGEDNIDTEKMIKEKAEHMKEQAKKLEEALKEEAPKWKQTIDQTIKDLEYIGEKLKEKLRNYR